MRKAIETFEKHQVEYILETEYYSYLPKRFKAFHDFYDKVGVNRNLIKEEYELEKLQVQKIEVQCPTDEALELCLDFLKVHPEYDYFESIAERIIEIYAKKNTKAVGILEALKYTGIPIENSYAFGDGKNDIEMLELVGCGIAMGNASDEVKSYANVITDTVYNNGVAKGIEAYILKEA